MSTHNKNAIISSDAEYQQPHDTSHTHTHTHTKRESERDIKQTLAKWEMRINFFCLFLFFLFKTALKNCRWPTQCLMLSRNAFGDSESVLLFFHSIKGKSISSLTKRRSVDRLDLALMCPIHFIHWIFYLPTPTTY